MTIEKGVDWGIAAEVPLNLKTVRCDYDASQWLMRCRDNGEEPVSGSDGR